MLQVLGVLLVISEYLLSGCMLARSVQSHLSLCNPMDYSLCPWNSPGKNTGVGCHFLQGIFPTQGLNPSLLHCSQIHYRLSRIPALEEH